MTERMPWKYFLYQRAADGKWCVFVAHDTTPGWLRFVAEFADQKRAESYCEIENWVADDGEAPVGDDVKPAPSDLFAEPATRVTPERLTVRTSVERREIEVTRESMPAAVGPHLRIAPSLAERMTEPAPKPVKEKPAKGHAGLPEGEHGRRRGAILQAIKDHIAEQDEFPSQTEIATKSGVSAGSLATYLAQLEQQGELAKDAAGCRYLPSRPDLSAKPRYGEQAKAAADLRGTPVPHEKSAAPQTSGIKVRPEAAAAVAAFRLPGPRIGRPPLNPEPEQLDHQMQRRCQGCNSIFKTDSIQQYLCDDCDRAAARLA